MQQQHLHLQLAAALEGLDLLTLAFVQTLVSLLQASSSLRTRSPPAFFYELVLAHLRSGLLSSVPREEWARRSCS